MDRFLKVLLLVLVAGYVISPVDMAPGPIDDILLTLCYLIINRHNSRNIDE